jgi:CRISPR/Cas system-associated exonuclease Cas4 (RecB family)
VARALSKSKIISYLQCSRRIWLEIHRPELSETSDRSELAMKSGNQVGEIAQQLYSHSSNPTVVDRESLGLSVALRRSQELLGSNEPIFEAGFVAAGAMVFTDVMLPVGGPGHRQWRMVEVKASTGVKDYHRNDIAIQAYVATKAGVPLASASIAYVDSSWVYPGDRQYVGLLKEEDLTAEALGRGQEVEGWIREAHKVVSENVEPEVSFGSQCYDPFECGFLNYCQSKEPQAEYPLSWLPRIQAKALKAFIAEGGVKDLRDVPDELLNERQQRVKSCTLKDEPWFDAEGARDALTWLEQPTYFLDFETIQFAVPIWKGTRPYQQIPFQFSLHLISSDGTLSHSDFLDLSGEDPSRRLAEALLDCCGEKGVIFAYNAAFERTRIKELADQFPELRDRLLSLKERVFDLLRVAERNYYNPIQQGSWSIKAVLPAVAPDLNYEALGGVQNGGMAMDAFLEAIDPACGLLRKEEIKRQLLAYCCLDTLAMVRVWEFFLGRSSQSDQSPSRGS